MLGYRLCISTNLPILKKPIFDQKVRLFIGFAFLLKSTDFQRTDWNLLTYNISFTLKWQRIFVAGGPFGALTGRGPLVFEVKVTLVRYAIDFERTDFGPKSKASGFAFQ